MADLKISELSALAGGNLVAADELAIVDDSASETKKITVSDLIANGVTVISDDTIPGAKILFGAGDIATAALADGAVTTAKVADDAITAAKLGNESTVDLVTTLPGTGAFTGQLAFDTDDNKLYIWDGSAWQSLKAAGSVNTVSGSTTGEINIVSSVSGDTVTLSATIDDTTSANQFLAGPTGAAGAVGYRVIDGSDLPVSTSSAKGGVIVNGEGLRMDASTIEVDNDVTASATHHVVTYDAKGLITGGRVLAASDLPIATASAVGGVIASTGLTVDGSGNLTIDNSVTADTYTKVTVAATGLVTAGSTLAASDLPNHSADLLTSGNIPLARIADNLVTGAKLADYASAKIGETNPTADYIGQLFFNPLTRDLSLWDGNVFQPIGISAGEIVFAGTYNATTNLLSSVTSDGTGAGFVVGQALPAASGTNKNFYVVVDVGGTGTSPAPAVALAPPDFVLSTGTEYKLIDVSETVTAQVASNVGFTPVGTIAANNVQTAIAEVDTEKVAKSGDTMTGDLTLNDANVVFEGATENDNETTLTVVDPTADRTITLPDVTGTVVTTGDTGTVTSTMLTDGTIVNADINASAEIAVSKLANGTARQLLQTDAGGTGVEFTSNVDVPGTLDVTGAATLDSTLDVAGLISADGKVSFPLGSASAPSLIPGADTNTGIFSPGADQLAITTAGTQRVTVDSSGNVLVGKTASTGVTAGCELRPAGMGVFTRASANPLQIRRLTDDGDLVEFYQDTGLIGSIGVQGTSLTVGMAGTEKLRIDSSGNVGIGVSSLSSGDGNLTVLADGTGAGTANTRLFMTGYEGTSGNGAGLWFGARNNENTGVIGSRTASGNIAFETYSGGWGERMRIDSSGNVGVGVTNPQTGLHISDGSSLAGPQNTGAGRLTIQNSSSADIQLMSANTGYNHIFFGDQDDANAGVIYYQHSGNANALVFMTSAAERMRIDSSGNVGIGTSSPNNTFDVVGSSSTGASSAGNVAEFAGPSSTNGFQIFVNDTDNNSGIQTKSADALIINPHGGNVGIGTSTLGSGLLTVYGSGARTMFQGSSTGTGNGNGFTTGNNGSTDAFVWNYENGFIQFATNSTERMRIDSSGDVEIMQGQNLTWVFAGGSTHRARIRAESSDALIFENGSGNSERMRIDSSGELSISSTRSGNQVSDSIVKFNILNSNGDSKKAEIKAIKTSDVSSELIFSTTASHAFAERMRIDSSGNVGINLSSPTSQSGKVLHIAGDTGGQARIHLTTSASGHGANDGAYLVALGAESGSNAGTLSIMNLENSPMTFLTNSTERMRIRPDGETKIYDVYTRTDAASPNMVVKADGSLRRSTSSIKYKTNVETLEDNYADAILNVRPVWYRSLCEGNPQEHSYYGFIAEEVAEIDPRLVHFKTTEITYNENGSTVTTPCDPEPEGVQYDRFVPHLLNLIKRQQAAIETLETKVAALEAG